VNATGTEGTDWGSPWQRRQAASCTGHGGWVGGHRSQLRISPSEKVAVIVMLNCDDGDPTVIADRAMAMVAPVISRITSVPAAQAVPDFRVGRLCRHLYGP